MDTDNFFDFPADDVEANPAAEPQAPATPPATPEPTPTPQPETVTIAKDDWEATQRAVQNSQKLQQDMARLFGGQPPQNEPDPVAPLLNPYLEKTKAELRAEIEIQAAIQQANQKHPDLIPYREHVGLEVARIEREYLATGKPINTAQVIEEGIKAFREKFPHIKPPSEVDTANKELTTMGLKMDLGQSETASTKKDIWAMSDEEFAALDRKIARNL